MGSASSDVGGLQERRRRDLDAMKKAMAEGAIVSYGSFAVINHQEGAPTHGSWFTATSMANLMKGFGRAAECARRDGAGISGVETLGLHLDQQRA
jgi:hypothetical protein